MLKPDQGPGHGGMLANQVPEAAITALRGLTCCGCDKCLAKAIAAALNAWPEAKRVKGYFTHDADYYEPAFILPLEAPQGRIPPQEGGDE